MMAKMGFKPSESTQQPLEITLRRGRGGLGLFEEQRAKEEADEEEKQRELQKKRKEYESDAESMAHRLALQAAHHRVSGQLFAMLKLAMNLREDSHAIHRPGLPGVEAIEDDPPPIVADAHIQSHFGKAGGMHELRALLSSMHLDDQEKHHNQLNRYLREDFLYCFYCAHSYESLEALQKFCPGVTEEEHQNAVILAPEPRPASSSPHSHHSHHSPQQLQWSPKVFAFNPSPSVMTSMFPEEVVATTPGVIQHHQGDGGLHFDTPSDLRHHLHSALHESIDYEEPPHTHDYNRRLSRSGPT